MVRTVLVCGLAALVLHAGAAAPAGAIPAKAKITTAGLGPIRIGMTERQVERANHRPVRIRRQVGRCGTARLGKRVLGLFTGRLLTRIYVNTRRYPTRSGIRVGDTEQDVHATYPGEVDTEPHKYDPDGHYLEIRDGNRKVVFETDGSRVRSISTGRRPEVDYVEGCS